MDGCILCQGGFETVNHLLIQCPFSLNIWDFSSANSTFRIDRVARAIYSWNGPGVGLKEGTLEFGPWPQQPYAGPSGGKEILESFTPPIGFPRK